MGYVMFLVALLVVGGIYMLWSGYKCRKAAIAMHKEYGTGYTAWMAAKRCFQMAGAFFTIGSILSLYVTIVRLKGLA